MGFYLEEDIWIVIVVRKGYIGFVLLIVIILILVVIGSEMNVGVVIFNLEIN